MQDLTLLEVLRSIEALEVSESFSARQRAVLFKHFDANHTLYGFGRIKQELSEENGGTVTHYVYEEDPSHILTITQHPDSKLELIYTELGKQSKASQLIPFLAKVKYLKNKSLAIRKAARIKVGDIYRSSGTREQTAVTELGRKYVHLDNGDQCSIEQKGKIFYLSQKTRFTSGEVIYYRLADYEIINACKQLELNLDKVQESLNFNSTYSLESINRQQLLEEFKASKAHSELLLERSKILENLIVSIPM